MIKAIIFDLAGVIYQEGYRPGIKYLEKKYHYPKNEIYKSCHDQPYWHEFSLGRISENEYLNQAAADFWRRRRIRLNVRELKATIKNKANANPGIVTLIRELKKDYKIGVVSNHPREWFSWLEKRFGLKGIFDVSAVSGLIHLRKPDIKIFKYALKKLKVKGEESLYIDDRAEMTKNLAKLGIRVVIFKNLKNLKIDIYKLTKKYG